MYIQTSSSTLNRITSLNPVKQGIPTNEELEELGNAIGENWKTLGRRLHDEEKLEEIDHAHRRLGEKGYQMLRHWKQKQGSSATYQALYSALTNKLVQRKDLAEKICCIWGNYSLLYYQCLMW